MKDSSRNNNAEIFSNLSENFSSHFIELCSSSDGDTVNPYDYFSQLIEWENSNADQIRNDQETLSRVLIEILNYFEIAFCCNSHRRCLPLLQIFHPDAFQSNQCSCLS